MLRGPLLILSVRPLPRSVGSRCADGRDWLLLDSVCCSCCCSNAALCSPSGPTDPAGFLSVAASLMVAVTSLARG